MWVKFNLIPYLPSLKLVYSYLLHDKTHLYSSHVPINYSVIF